jgi:dTDP-4-amino-4,6-dideoxygalactose transaminase
VSVPFVDLRRQFQSVRDELIQSVTSVLEGGHYILGEEVTAFEEEMAEFSGCKYGVGVNSGTDALLFALLGRGIGPGDEALTVANTFIATAEAIALSGDRPVFVDVDESTMTMDVDQARKKITPRTRAIIPVHLYGLPADMDPIMAMADHHGLTVIEDACQAIGAGYRGRRVGSIGHAGCFSFVPAKNLGGYGDGGMVVTSDEKLRDRIRMLRNHGSSRKYMHEVIGYNSRLDSLQAAALRVKLRRIDAWNALRVARAEQYSTLLKDTRVITPNTPAGLSPVFHLYVIRSRRRDALQAYLKEAGIETLIHYPVPIHRQQACAGYDAVSLPVTEQVSDEILSLPLFPEMSESQVLEVSERIHEFERTQG